ncbi:D-amino-acid dehydrogenase [Halolactibacillus halophilus]|uniref:D-amino-acid dehydrogenase n=1 Tax=Halolactibacillus halophilus TaxID=306540 RepID=A0A1I5LEU0_9BACI|nr:FAD-dependent oxidoreductase [Halolactibacillus halophilus]GEM00859.1 oxidoreductase [Halolactibacillus halophilus]SFO95693.1 D-amino-acid dehydrogenase [Halolactibacillus halophilus]
MKTFHIVGAGIAGASIAYHLLKLGQRIIIYDREDDGQATNASAGIICPWTSQRRNKKWYRLVKEGAKYYPNFIKELESFTQKSTGFRQNGALCLFKDDHIQNLAYKRIQSKQKDAPEMGQVLKLTSEELLNFHPSLTTDFPAVFVEGGAQVDGASLLSALKHAINSLGGEWIHDSVDPHTLDGQVIYTAGAWSHEYTPHPEVRHQRAELLEVALANDLQPAVSPVVMGLGPMYIVPTETQHYMIGTTHEDTTSFDIETSEDARDYLFTQVKRYFKGTALTKGQSSIGLRPLTDQNLPYIGPSGNMFVVNGLGSSGLTAAPVIGREVAQYLTGQSPVLDLTDYHSTSS